MRLIPFLGILMFFKNIYIECSYRALIVAVNGFLCHGLRKIPINKIEKTTNEILFLRKYDTVCNILMILYTLYNNPELFLYAMFASMSFILEMYIETNHILSYTFTDTMHVLFVQLPLAYALNKTLTK